MSTKRVIVKNVSSCEECPYYETSEHEDYGIYYTMCALFDVQIKSKDYYQPKALFVMCQLPTEKENFIKSSR